MEEQSGVKEKKVIKSARIAYITFTQRLTDRVEILSSDVRTYVFTPHGIWPADLSDKFCSIEADLNDVVEQSKRWCQWEGGHKQRHKPVLDYCG